MVWFHNVELTKGGNGNYEATDLIHDTLDTHIMPVTGSVRPDYAFIVCTGTETK